MTSTATTAQQYLDTLPEDRKEAMTRLRNTVLANLPPGFEEQMAYGMLTYVVPLHTFPDGYHCDPKQPLPFLSIASQKNHVAVYHMGLYSNPSLLEWFTEQYAQQVTTKLDMGKSCIRFKNIQKIPYDLLGTLFSKMEVAQWVEIYQSQLNK